jgi:hypothetical protein
MSGLVPTCGTRVVTSSGQGGAWLPSSIHRRAAGRCGFPPTPRMATVGRVCDAGADPYGGADERPVAVNGHVDLLAVAVLTVEAGVAGIGLRWGSPCDRRFRASGRY